MRVTRKECLTEAFKLLDQFIADPLWTQANAAKAQGWIMLARELDEGGSLRVEN